HDVLKDLRIQEEQMRLSQETRQLLSSIEDQTEIDWIDIIADLKTKFLLLFAEALIREAF
ncbi:unnamed protein product, partial [Rotaria sp. Silwood1]